MLNLKNKIKKQLIELLESELLDIEEAAKSSREYAIQDDFKSEGKYDTRAIEASYMASAQSARVEELKLDLQMIKELEVNHTPNHIELGALVLLEQNDRDIWYFISSALGGTMLNIDNKIILVISVFSPVGSEALNLAVNDTFEVETPKENRLYLVKGIY
jgi:transcription elongation GreA/GreB family factor